MIELNNTIRVSGKPTVSARKVHLAIGGQGDFPGWITYRVKKYKFVEGVDYTTSIGHNNQKDYNVTTSMAMALAQASWSRNGAKVSGDIQALDPDTEAFPVSIVTKGTIFEVPSHLAGVKTMCSVEIVDVINALRGPGKAVMAHDNFLKKVAAHPGIPGVRFYGGYFDPNGQRRPCYYLPKREAELMVMSESLEVQTKVYDRLTELEATAVPALGLPTNYLDALKQLVASVEVTQQQAVQISHQTTLIEMQKPSVEFVDKYVDAKELKPFRVVAKILGANEREFRNFLVDRGYHKRLNGKWVHADRYGPKGTKLFDIKTSVNSEGVVFEQTRFTPKGVVYISEKWNNRVPMLRKPLKLAA